MTLRCVSFEVPSSVPLAARGRAADNDGERAVICKLPELAMSKAAKTWWVALVAHLPRDLPQLVGVRRQDFHDQVTARLDDADDAIQIHDGMTGFDVKKCQAGRHGRPGRDLPPSVKRRGTALHPVYEVLDPKGRGGEIQHVHRTRGPQVRTMYYAMNCVTDHWGVGDIQLGRLRRAGGAQGYRRGAQTSRPRPKQRCES